MARRRTEQVDESDTSSDRKETDLTEEYAVDDSPDLRASRSQERDHTPDAYTTGYDEVADTRVGLITGAEGTATARQSRHNEGRHQSDGEHSTRESQRDKKRITQAFCSRLGVTEFQQQRAITAMGLMNLDRFGHQKRLTKVALVTIKVVVEYDRSSLVDPQTMGGDTSLIRLLNDDMFTTLLDQNNVSRSDVFSVSQLVKRELKKYGFFDKRIGMG